MNGLPGSEILLQSTMLAGVPANFPDRGPDYDLALARRAIALAPQDGNGKLLALQGEAIRLGRCDHIETTDIADVLIDAAEANGLVKPIGKFDRETIEHVIREGIVGNESIVTPSPELNGAADHAPVPSDDKRELIVRRACDIEPEKIEWLWPGRVAVGKTTLFGGEPGLGKSQLTYALAAAVTTGGDWPCNEGTAPLGSVLILSAEDDAADTIRPRLDAAGADAKKVLIVSSVRQKDNSGNRRTFNMQADLDLLEREITKAGDVRLLVIDPISSYLGKTDSHKNADVRATLEPLAEMATRLRVAVVAVTHFSKGGGKSAVDSFIGSIAFVAAARAAFTVMRDPDDHDRRLFLTAKNNLAKDGGGLSFRLVQQLLPDSDILASSIAWDSEHVTKTADQVLAERADADAAPSRREAEDFLREALAGGPRPSKEIEGDAKEAGVSWRTVERAKKQLGVIAERAAVPGTGSDGKPPRLRFYWRLPDGPGEPYSANSALVRQPSDVADLGKSGGLGLDDGGDR